MSASPSPTAALYRVLIALIMASLVAMTGCDSLQKKHDNPVMTAAPRRVKKIESNDSAALVADNDTDDTIDLEDDGTDIVQIKRELTKKNPWDDWKDDTAIFNSQVAATVNGAPILNGDVLDQHSAALQGECERMRKSFTDPKFRAQNEPPRTPDDYEKLRYFLISRQINIYIQRKLLVEYLKAGLKPEQVKLMDGHIDDQFAIEVEKLKKELKVTNKTELELELNKKGTTLQNVKDNFALQRLAEECIGIKTDKREPVERPDLVAYYREHQEDYAVATRLKWQQIQISFGTVNGKVDKEGAQEKMQQAIAELNRGTKFEEVARKYSDGPTAKDGGNWDWLQEGNLADSKLEKKLFESPVGKLSKIHEGPTSYSVTRVTERQEAGYTPFKEVQDEIKKKMLSEQDQKRYEKFMKKLYATAVIETQYERPQYAEN